MEETLIKPISGGLFEITNGANLVVSVNAPLFQEVLILTEMVYLTKLIFAKNSLFYAASGRSGAFLFFYC
jgi:hypothetical protein